MERRKCFSFVVLICFFDLTARIGFIYLSLVGVPFVSCMNTSVYYDHNSLQSDRKVIKIKFSKYKLSVIPPSHVPTMVRGKECPLI